VSAVLPVVAETEADTPAAAVTVDLQAAGLGDGGASPRGAAEGLLARADARLVAVLDGAGVGQPVLAPSRLSPATPARTETSDAAFALALRAGVVTPATLAAPVVTTASPSPGLGLNGPITVSGNALLPAQAAPVGGARDDGGDEALPDNPAFPPPAYDPSSAPSETGAQVWDRRWANDACFADVPWATGSAATDGPSAPVAAKGLDTAACTAAAAALAVVLVGPRDSRRQAPEQRTRRRASC
jgi:hypothetical protein